MPVTLGQLTSNRKAVKIELDGLELNIEYYPMRVTAEMLIEYSSIDKLKEMPDDQALEVITSPDETLLHLLASWDLAEPLEDGITPSDVVLPLTAETIAALGLVLQWAFVHAIMADAGNVGKTTAPEGSAKKRLSGATSSRKVRSVRSRTGTR